MTQRDDSDSPIPPEPDREQEMEMAKQVGLRLIKENVDALDDPYLAQIVAIYHEEWERRHGERWVLSE